MVVKMNKLKQGHSTKKPWGLEIMWALTDNYMSKVIKISPNKQTPLLVHENKEKSLMVIKGKLRLTHGKCCDEKDLVLYELPKWSSVDIRPGEVFRYAAGEEPVILMEMSDAKFEDALMVKDENDTPPEIDIEKVIKKEKPTSQGKNIYG